MLHYTGGNNNKTPPQLYIGSRFHRENSWFLHQLCLWANFLGVPELGANGMARNMAKSEENERDVHIKQEAIWAKKWERYHHQHGEKTGKFCVRTKDTF